MSRILLRNKKLILGKSDAFYEKMALNCSQNAFDVLCNANHLVFGKTYARAFALGVISAEEYSKAILFKAVSLHLVKLETLLEKDSKHFLPFDHVEKQKAVRAFITLSLGLFDYDQIARAAEAMVAKQPIPIFTPNEEKCKKILNIFENIEQWKQDSLYVDFDGKEILIPKEIITEKRCLELLDTLQEALPNINNWVKTDSRILRAILAQLPKGNTEKIL